MADFDWNQWTEHGDFRPTAISQGSEIRTVNGTLSDDATIDNTSDTTQLEGIQTPQSRERQRTSGSSQSEALIRRRKTRKLRDRHETAKIREKGACFLCQTKRKEVNLVY
jgi:hypothetical protein